VLAVGAVPPELLPRAAALTPQWLAMLRQTQLPVAALAQRVSRDMVLAAEVLRRASSSIYRAQGEVTDLQRAIVLIGEQGLQSAIARVLLKAVFEASPGALGARSAARLWDCAEAMADDTALQAAAAGLPAFDGYLAGLLQPADGPWP
jgi:HD-like signal output (HDOD) protein